MRNKERSLLQIIKERSPVTVVGIILLSITATVVYDLAVKPGLSSAGRFFLNIMTLGSQKVQDTAYAEAAIDPTPVTSLILLLFLVGVILPPLITSLFFPFLERIRKKFQEIRQLEKDLDGAAEAEKEAILDRLEGFWKKLKRLRTYVSILAAAFVLGFIVIVFIHNQSVLVWRTFHADLTLLRPHITNEKDREPCAHFSAMTKRNDYLIIKKDMEDIANRNNVRLHDIKLW